MGKAKIQVKRAGGVGPGPIQDAVKPQPEHQGGVGRARRVMGPGYGIGVAGSLQRRVGNSYAGGLLGVQGKIPVSTPGDQYEQEAEAAAGRVVSGQKVGRIARNAVGSLVASIGRQLPEEEQPARAVDAALRGVEEIAPGPETESPTPNGVQAKSVPVLPIGPVLMRTPDDGEDAPGHSPWTLKGALAVLCSDPDGIATVKILKTYSVYAYDSYTYKRQYYTDETKTTKKGAPEPHSINGYHNRSKKEIGILSSRTNAKVASTLVHEVVHAKQHLAYEEKLKTEPAAPAPTKAEKEYEAHIKQEEFNIRNNIPPKHKSFRKKEDGKWVVDEAAIKKWVDRVYGIGPAKHYTNYDYKMTGKKGPITPWECPK